ncbi:MAG: hypothetical protein KAU01_11095, partial [Candidatus Cloacimonetes bacterium]|nr:hypothetical protein [Candidatus Cloacimonadota bacterium]
MRTLFFVLVFFILSILLSATIINVPGDQPTIQEGINVAVDSDTVLVQPDTYFENIDYNGKNITVASLFLTTQNTTYISQTVIDGNQNGSVVIFNSGEDSTAVLTGFTITNGYAIANYGGGGIYLNNTNPKLINLIISNNSTIYDGGGIRGNGSSPSLVNVKITCNSASYGGGILLCNSNSTLENVTITGNSAVIGGGGIDFFTCSPSLENVSIIGNSAGDKGGGIYFELPCLPNLVNVIIADNSADLGGGIYSWASNPNLINVTLSSNSADFGGGIYCFDSNPSLVNCILWNDSPEEIYFGEDFSPNSVTISYSDIQGGEAGIVTNNSTVYWLEGNIDEDPLFVGAGEHPYSLLEDSPCIDAGNPDPIFYDPEDPSNPSYALYPAMGTIINDMGAYGGPNAIGWPVVGLNDNVIVQT